MTGIFFLEFRAMALEFSEKNEWLYVPAPGRLDSFNFEATKKDLDDLCQRSSQIAFDVAGAHFVSIPMIKYLHSLALDLAKKGGRLALVGTTEKLKRQIGIFADTDPIMFISSDNWEKLTNTNLKGNA